MSEEQKMTSEKESQEPQVLPSETNSGVTSEESNLKNKKVNPLVMVLGGFVFALLFGCLIFYGVAIAQVKSLSRTSFTLKSASLLQLPIASINGQKVLYTDYVDNLQAMENFYKTDTSGETEPTKDEKSDFILSRLFINNLVEQIAKDMGVTVSQDDINKIADEQIIPGFADRTAAETEIKNRYGWTFDEFLKKIVYPTELEKKISEKYSADHPADSSANDAVRTQALEILQKIKDGADFAKMAKQYGSDGTKDQGGDLGWFSRGQMVPEFENAAFSLKKGELDADLVKTQYGYHILQVTNKRTTKDADGKDVEEVQARHILFPVQENSGEDFRNFMNDKLKKSDIKIIANVHNPFEDLFTTTSTTTNDSDNLDTSSTDTVATDTNK
ncbi:MAG: peptidylprolyl isomerase [Candidatus Magasanikbacteria bacterium]